MSSHVRVVSLCVWIALLGGCFKTTKCEQELCDGVDNDCDQAIDEDFKHESGVYARNGHCGACNLACGDVLPSAQTTLCEVRNGRAQCVLESCAAGSHSVDGRSCVPEIPIDCLPCATDLECDRRLPGARCLPLGEDDQRCLRDCEDALCPDGFACGGVDGGLFCLPAGGTCSCVSATIGARFGCLVETSSDAFCAGAQTCEENGLGDCIPTLIESCNAFDDDCDGHVDEDFADDEGRFVSELHCGACNAPCAAPGPHMTAVCKLDDAGIATCELACEDGYVDVDGLPASGCECERFEGQGTPPPAGTDSDCDGVPDDDDRFVYVTTTGNDLDSGTLARPMRTLQAAATRGAAEGKDVLVAEGSYVGHVELVAGVSMFGGYRADFRQRDLSQFATTLVRGGVGGLPVLTCRGLDQVAQFDGFTLRGSDAAVPGQGSTVIYLDDCGPLLTLRDLQVIAARGEAGARGADSSDALAELGIESLAELDGVDGQVGALGTPANQSCVAIGGGAGGGKACPGADVSGGTGGAGGCPDLGCSNGMPCGNAGCEDFGSDGTCDLEAVLAAAVPNPNAEDGAGPGAGEAGAWTYDAPTTRGGCNFCDDNPSLLRNGGDGTDGAAGTNGDAGEGCLALVAFDALHGRAWGASGDDGTSGEHGSGGGGGTAGAGYAVIAGTAGACESRSGGSGGGGGSGGCGAPGGGGGGGGGASVGIALRLNGRSAGPRFESVRVVTASGGSGGAGGIGASGGAPGSGALGGDAIFWCARNGGRGGNGGAGGSGGGGGGGCGGGSHGVFIDARQSVAAAYASAVEASVTVDRAGIPGSAGPGGFSPAAPGGQGALGDDSPVFVLAD